MIQLIQTVRIETGKVSSRRRRGRFGGERYTVAQTVTISGTLPQMKNLLNGLRSVANACPFQLAALGLASGICPNTGARVSSKAPIEITLEFVRDLDAVLNQLERCQ